jgi:hypothetical protein
MPTPALTIVDQLSPEQFKEVLPVKMRKAVNVEVIDKVNLLLANPDMAETYRENLLSFSMVLTEGKFKLTGYIDAIKYVSLKVCGLTNLRAFEVTFPKKIQEWLARGVLDKDIASYVSSYNKSKLVNLILEQTLIPTHILNADLYQKALNVQASIMMDPDMSGMVRTTAANSLLVQLKMPETKKIELDIKTTESSVVAELRAATAELTARQRELITTGDMNAQQIAHSRIQSNEEITDVDV